MMFVVQWLLSALVLALTAMLVPGVDVTFGGALLASLVIGLLNVFVKPILTVLTLPLNMLTLGLFTFVLNGLIILLAGAIVPGFFVAGLGWAILFSVVLTIVNVVFYSLTASVVKK